jgi:hypothetical protein
MRQVLLAARQTSRGNYGGDPARDDVLDRGPRRPVVLWMDDTVRLGDGFTWHGDVWVVSAVYGTHFSSSAKARRTERPRRVRDDGDGLALPLDRRGLSLRDERSRASSASTGASSG